MAMSFKAAVAAGLALGLAFVVAAATPCAAVAQEDEAEAYQQAFQAGITLLTEKKYDESIRHFQKCIEIEPDNTLHYYFLGSFYDMKNDRENAIHSFQEYLVRGGTKYRTKASELLKTMGVAVDELPRAAAPAKEEILFGPDPDEKG